MPDSVDSSGEGSYTATGLTFDDTYSFRIRAEHCDGTVSGYSSGQVTPVGLLAPTLSATTPATPADPRYPIHLSWTPSAGADSSGVYEYELEYRSSTTAGPGWIPYGTQGGLQGGDTLSTDLDIADGASGSFRIRAIYNDGNMSEWGYAGPVTEPLSAGEALGDSPGINPTVVSDTEIDLSWQTVEGEGITLAMGTLPGLDGEGDSHGVSTNGVVDENGTSFLALTGLTPGTQYYFALTLTSFAPDGILDISYGSASATTTGSAEAVPAEPSFVAGVLDPNDGDQIDLHWVNSPGDETGYDILRSINGGAFQSDGPPVGADDPIFEDQLPSNFLPGEAVSYEVEAFNAAGTSQPATTQPSTQGTLIPKVLPNQAFTLTYKGPGKPKFLQTVFITGIPITPGIVAQETLDHGGKNPFNGPVPDNRSGNPNQDMGSIHVPGGWLMEDGPTFPGYPLGFVGTKSFVTTVVDAKGDIVGTVHWHASINAQGKITTTVDN